jgi:hypothetical protein
MATAYKTTHDNSDDATGPQAPDTGGDKIDRMPLFRALPEGRAFPVEALPEPLRGAVEALAAKVECPIAIAAGSVLAAASLATQGHADVVLPHDGGTVAPLSLFILTIADSGSRKSTADKLAMRPINDFEAELIRQHVERREDYRIRHAAWDEASKKAKSKSGGDRSNLETSLRTLGKEPERPMDPALTVTEPTLPALEKAFRVGRPALGLLRDN